jgi:putative FmdB family regulatory protein
MPTYEYECCDCQSRVELLQRVNDPPLKKCEKCGGRMRKLLFPVGIIFKGSGFYTTDYARKGAPFADGDGGNGKHGSKSDEKKEKDKEPAKTDAKK